MDLSVFLNKNLFEAGQNLFEQFGITFKSSTAQSLNIKEVLKDYINQDILINAVSETYYLGIIDDNIFEDTLFANEAESFSSVSKRIDDKYKGILAFAVNLATNTPTNSILSEITRAFNRASKRVPVIVIYKYKIDSEDYISFTASERTTYLQSWREGEKIGKVTLLKDIRLIKTHSAHIQILKSLSLDICKKEIRVREIKTFDDLYYAWRKIFNTEVLNNQFYQDYQQLSTELIRKVKSQFKNKLLAHQGILNLLNRIMFVYFLQKKNWLMEDEYFIKNLWQDYLLAKDEQPEKFKTVTFHHNWLNEIFFNAFCKGVGKNINAHKTFPDKYKEAFPYFPFLNGGLFSRNEEYDDFLLEDKYFEKIFNFFEGYIFTITEDTPAEINLEINPELLGRMYEGMINATDLDDVDAEHGIIYTERPEINFMTRRSMVEVLDKKLNSPNSSKKYSREFLYHFCFDEPSQKVEVLKKYKVSAQEIKNAIISTTICDPACGSGSMLVGFLQLQVELVKCLDEILGIEHNSKYDFKLKKQLITESIYGVDIKEWAVRIAELRLWLYMIAEVELNQEERIENPLLPNLDFKLRPGNSLIQKFGSGEFNIKNLLDNKDKRLKAFKDLNEFIEKKKKYVRNELDASYDLLKNEEVKVFQNYIDHLLIEHQQTLKQYKSRTGEQISLLPEDEFELNKEDLFLKQRETILKEIESLENLKEKIKKEKKIPFSYEIDFMEIFFKEADPGFDLVIGNPPYVRQEDILPSDDAEYLEKLLKPGNEKKKREANSKMKEELNQKIYSMFPFLNFTKRVKIEDKIKSVPIYGNKVPGRSDLYIYFQILSPILLNPKGTFCFIISNSWMDVDFGSFIQNFLINHTEIFSIYDCNTRSFDASINTVIYLHSALGDMHRTEIDYNPKYYKEPKCFNNSVRFIMNKIDFNDAAFAPILIEQENCKENTFRPFYRVIPFSQRELYRIGLDTETDLYSGDKWGGKYLRAPEIYYTILEKGKNKLVRLGDIADVKFGIKTGANEFFYLPNKYFDIKEKSKSYKLIPLMDDLPYDIEIEKEFLKPVFKTPKESKTINLTKNNFELLVLMIDVEPKHLKDYEVRKYLKFGESIKIQNKPTCASRTLWYSLNPDFGANLFLQMSYGDTFKVFYSKEKVFADARLYEIKVEDSEHYRAILNSTLTSLFTELYGRANLGDGALDFKVYEAKEIMTLIKTSKIINTNSKIFSRPILPIYKELGFDLTLPIRDQNPKPLIDRKELDDIVFDEIGLTKEERNELYWSVAELVKQRLSKAASR